MSKTSSKFVSPSFCALFALDKVSWYYTPFYASGYFGILHSKTYSLSSIKTEYRLTEKIILRYLQVLLKALTIKVTHSELANKLSIELLSSLTMDTFSDMMRLLQIGN